MKKLTEDLKQEHNQIVQILKDTLAAGISTRQGKEKLLSAKELFSIHLRKEDTKLYPLLKKAAETDKQLARTMEVLSRDMARISNEILRFFKKYEREDSPIDFSEDFGKLFTILASRIRKEEEILFREYEKCIAKQNEAGHKKTA